MDGSGQKLEQRFRLSVWSETDGWMKARCSDLFYDERGNDAKSLLKEFRVDEIK